MNFITSPLLSEISKNLFPFVKKGQTLIIGLSGGPDSVFLLSVLKKLQKKLGIHLIAGHLNHKLRGQESKIDAAFAETLCKKLNILFETQTLNIKNIAKKHKKNLEACGREARYVFFRELKKKHKAQWIVTAHHLDDNIETVLLNFARGCALNGIAGMNIRNKDILRPMLTIPKKNILDFLKKNKMKYRKDSTNLNKKFIRNFTRIEIVPRIRKLNPAFDDIFLRNMTYFQELKNFIENLAQTVMLSSAKDFTQNNSAHTTKRSTNITKSSETDKTIKMRREIFQSFPPFFQSEILKKIHIILCGGTESLSKTQMDQVLQLLKSPKTGKMKTFGAVTALIHRDHIEFFKKNLYNR